MKILLSLISISSICEPTISTLSYLNLNSKHNSNLDNNKVSLNQLTLNITCAKTAFDLAQKIANKIVCLYNNYNKTTKLSVNTLLSLNIFSIFDSLSGEKLDLNDKTTILKLNNIYEVDIFVQNENSYFSIMNQPHKINLNLTSIDINNLTISFTKSQNFKTGLNLKNYILLCLKNFYNTQTISFGLSIKDIMVLENDSKLNVEIYDVNNKIVALNDPIYMSSKYSISIFVALNDSYFQTTNLYYQLDLNSQFFNIKNLSFQNITYQASDDVIRNQIYNILLTNYNNFAVSNHLKTISIDNLKIDPNLEINFKKQNSLFLITILVHEKDFYFVANTYSYSFRINLINIEQLAFSQPLKNDFDNVFDWRNFIYQKIATSYNNIIKNNVLTLSLLENDSNITTTILENQNLVKNLNKPIDISKNYSLIFDINNNDSYFYEIHHFQFIDYKMNYKVNLNTIDLSGIEASNGKALWSKIYSYIVNEYNKEIIQFPYKLPQLSNNLLINDPNLKISVFKYDPIYLQPPVPIANDVNTLIKKFNENIEITISANKNDQYFNYTKKGYTQFFWIRKFNLTEYKVPAIPDTFVYPVSKGLTTTGEEILCEGLKAFTHYIDKKVYKNDAIYINYLDLRSDPNISFKIFNNSKVVSLDEKVSNFESNFVLRFSINNVFDKYFEQTNNFEFCNLFLTRKSNK